jgi:hypothetical protein
MRSRQKLHSASWCPVFQSSANKPSSTRARLENPSVGVLHQQHVGQMRINAYDVHHKLIILTVIGLIHARTESGFLLRALYICRNLLSASVFQHF